MTSKIPVKYTITRINGEKVEYQVFAKNDELKDDKFTIGKNWLYLRFFDAIPVKNESVKQGNEILINAIEIPLEQYDKEKPKKPMWEKFLELICTH